MMMMLRQPEQTAATQHNRFKSGREKVKECSFYYNYNPRGTFVILFLYTYTHEETKKNPETVRTTHIVENQGRYSDRQKKQQTERSTIVLKWELASSLCGNPIFTKQNPHENVVEKHKVKHTYRHTHMHLLITRTVVTFRIAEEWERWCAGRECVKLKRRREGEWERSAWRESESSAREN